MSLQKISRVGNYKPSTGGVSVDDNDNEGVEEKENIKTNSETAETSVKPSEIDLLKKNLEEIKESTEDHTVEQKTLEDEVQYVIDNGEEEIFLNLIPQTEKYQTKESQRRIVRHFLANAYYSQIAKNLHNFNLLERIIFFKLYRLFFEKTALFTLIIKNLDNFSAKAQLTEEDYRDLFEKALSIMKTKQEFDLLICNIEKFNLRKQDISLMFLKITEKINDPAFLLRKKYKEIIEKNVSKEVFNYLKSQSN